MSSIFWISLLDVLECCRHVLHKYANEDVSIGSWFIGLDVEHIDDRRLCCGTPPGNNNNHKRFLDRMLFG